MASLNSLGTDCEKADVVMLILFMFIAGILLAGGFSICYIYYIEAPEDWGGRTFYRRLAMTFAVIIVVWFASLIQLLIHIW